jgi:serine/threonine-protein kinase HipA
MSELRVLIDEEEVGSIFQGAAGKLRFVYDDEWRNRIDAVPLSLSMPLTAKEHLHKAIEPYLWNLLPDREETLRQIAAEHEISHRNPFALVGARGEDLPGSVQIVPLERMGNLRKRERITRVSEEQLAEILHNRQRASGKTHVGEDSGFFSLAGAQPKLAVCRVGGRWYEQRGYTPSTHIVKPSIPDLVQQVENEHFCLRLAEACGLHVIKSEVVRIGDLQTIVVPRYDRVRIKGRQRLPLESSGGKVWRIHQEDVCSALSVHPANKYQHQGGPGMKQVMRLLEGSGNPDIDRERFMRACAFNFVIAGVDAHGKNYSLLMEAGGRFRLAPLYDIISALPYDRETYNRLAMAVGGERKYTKIFPSHWEKAASDSRYDPAKAVGHVREYLTALPAASQIVLQSCRDAGLADETLTLLTERLDQRCKELMALYD